MGGVGPCGRSPGDCVALHDCSLFPTLQQPCTRDMGKTTRKTKAVRLTEQDYAIIATLQQHYGIASANEVIRMALRAALARVAPHPYPNKERFSFHP